MEKNHANDCLKKVQFPFQENSIKRSYWSNLLCENKHDALRCNNNPFT